jgi:hypothetical protein
MLKSGKVIMVGKSVIKVTDGLVIINSFALSNKVH